MSIKFVYHAGEAHLEIHEDGQVFHYYGTQIFPLLEEIPGLREFIEEAIELGKKSSHSKLKKKPKQKLEKSKKERERGKGKFSPLG